MQAFIDHPKPLIALVQGPAVGIAVTTLGLCDVVYCSDRVAYWFCRHLTPSRFSPPSTLHSVRWVNRLKAARRPCSRVWWVCLRRMKWARVEVLHFPLKFTFAGAAFRQTANGRSGKGTESGDGRVSEWLVWKGGVDAYGSLFEIAAAGERTVLKRVLASNFFWINSENANDDFL